MLYGYLKEWSKNPHWSVSCCLALLLPLNDLQGEISGFVGVNAINSQLQTGETEMPTIFGAVKDSGAIDVNLEGAGGQEDEDKVKVLNRCQGNQCINAKYHQGTQTELFTHALPVAAVVTHEPKEEKQDDQFVSSEPKQDGAVC